MSAPLPPKFYCPPDDMTITFYLWNISQVKLLEYILVFFRSRQKMIDLQYLTFWYQTIVSSLIYIPSLITIFVFVNFDIAQWMNVQTHIVFSKYEFKLHIFTCMVMGLISLVLAYSPNYLAGFEECFQSILG